MCDFESDIVAEEFLVVITVLSSHSFSRFSLQRGSIVCGFSQLLSLLLVDCHLPALNFSYSLVFSSLGSIYSCTCKLRNVPKLVQPVCGWTYSKKIKKEKKSSFYFWLSSLVFHFKFFSWHFYFLMMPLVISCSLLSLWEFIAF